MIDMHYFTRVEGELTRYPEGATIVKRENWSKGLIRAIKEHAVREYFIEIEYIYILDRNSDTIIIYPPVGKFIGYGYYKMPTV